MRSWFNVFSLRSFKKLKWKNVFMFVMYINIYKWNERRRAHDISLNHSLYRRVMHNVLQHDLAVLRNGLKLLPCYYTHLIKFTCELVCFDIDVWKVIDMALNLKVVIRPNVVFFFPLHCSKLLSARSNILSTHNPPCSTWFNHTSNSV